tara:strand:+ start:299 stop:703 length:405 start_codon:yes stop_codon:yes gene_type:complete
MADTVASQTLQDGIKQAVFKFTNVSDGTGESAVTKIDVSNLSKNEKGQSCTRVTIDEIWWQCNGMKVQVLFDASSNLLCIELGENQSGHHDYSSFGGLVNNAGSGVTGDILFTTVGHSSADTYTITMKVRKSYE